MASGRSTQAGRDAYAPRVHFVAGGVAHDFVSPFGRYPPAFSVGEALWVLYDAADPERAEVDSPGQLWGPVVLSGVLGVLLSALGGWLVRRPCPDNTASRARVRK